MITTLDIFIFLLSATTAAIPIPILRLYNTTNNSLYILAAVISYSILIMTYIYLLQNNSMSILYPLLKVSSILIVIFSGLLFFNEKLSKYQIAGIVFGLLSIILMSM